MIPLGGNGGLAFFGRFAMVIYNQSSGTTLLFKTYFILEHVSLTEISIDQFLQPLFVEQKEFPNLSLGPLTPVLVS